MKKIFLSGVAILATFSIYAQTYSDNYLRTHPVWIQMMDNKNVNYYDAQKAFELFWEGRELPVEEHELLNADNKEKEKKNFISKKRKNKGQAAIDYAFEYKRFKNWLIKNESLIKNDGTLLKPDERIEQWKAQQQNRK